MNIQKIVRKDIDHGALKIYYLSLNQYVDTLGGLKKIDIAQEEFDTFFLSSTVEQWNKNFFKVTEVFTEKNDASFRKEHSKVQEKRREQDVH